MLQATALAFATIFVAELGDKSQLLALSLSARYRTSVMLAAVFAASALTMGVSAAAGAAIGEVLPRRALSVGAGLLFLVFAVTTWRKGDDQDGEEEDIRAGGGSGFVTVVLAMSLAELGDKTMIAALALAATASTIGVWVGATLGMAAASGAAVLLGSMLWQRLSRRAVRLASAGLFTTAGVVLLVGAFVP